MPSMPPSALAAIETANSHKLKPPAISADSAFRSRSTREPGYETDLVALVSNGSMVPIPLRLIVGYGFM